MREAKVVNKTEKGQIVFCRGCNVHAWYNKIYIMDCLRKTDESFKSYHKARAISPERVAEWHKEGTILKLSRN